MSTYAIAPNQNDCDTRFYIPSDSTADARSLGYADQRGPNSDFLMRMTPGTVNLTKGEPVDFIVHVKALRDFEGLNSLVLKLEPVLGRGTANFVQPEAMSVPGEPEIRLDRHCLGLHEIRSATTEDWLELQDQGIQSLEVA